VVLLSRTTVLTETSALHTCVIGDGHKI